MAGLSPIPENYPRLCPYLAVGNAAAAIDFYGRALGATERLRIKGPDGQVAHAELAIGASVLMLADESASAGNKGPLTLGGTPVSLVLYVEDVDAVFASAIAAGAKQVRAVADQSHGDRQGGFEDPFGHLWWVASRIKDVSHEEMSARGPGA
jgi:PhnB protein